MSPVSKANKLERLVMGKNMASFQFGNVVVVDGDQIGVIVKSWSNGSHDVYVRNYNGIREYMSHEIRHFIYSKELSDDEKEFYP